jgi:hypothetical protein
LTAIAIALVAFVVMLGGACAGIVLRRLLPKQHLNDHSKDVVRLGSGLVATLSALVLGLLITSAKNSYDTQRDEVRHITAKLILLDDELRRYGPETRPARILQRQAIASIIDRIWGERGITPSAGEPFRPNVHGGLVVAAIESLSPQDEVQRALKFQALKATTDIGESRVLLFEQSDMGLPAPLLVMLVFWLTILLASFTLFSRINPTGAVALVIIALSASGAIFLILEMNHPFSGLMQIPSAPLRNALGGI